MSANVVEESEYCVVCIGLGVIHYGVVSIEVYALVCVSQWLCRLCCFYECVSAVLQLLIEQFLYFGDGGVAANTMQLMAGVSCVTLRWTNWLPMYASMARVQMAKLIGRLTTSE